MWLTDEHERARDIYQPGELPTLVGHESAGEPNEVDGAATSQGPPFLVAAVGASAGGLEAFSSLLRQIPAEAPLALVLVSHLAPDHRSMLPELLGNATKLVVETGDDNLAIEPGHVYVIQPGTRMTVIDGHLRVQPRPQQRAGTEGPIDAVFRSVANQYKDKAVGVVLSGSAHDGAAGLQEIKAAGGITMVQLPEEAEIDGMPRAAIATGAVDVVLPVAAIADRLVRLATHPMFRQQSMELESDLPAVANQRRRIFQLLRRTTRVDFNHYKTPTISRRIHRRMALHRLSSLAEYVAYVERDPKELERLQEDLLVHVTSFFREPESFGALAQSAFPRMLEKDRDAPFRVWVPGCSSGEEVYSLAMAIVEFRGEKVDAAPLQIFGTDVSESTIEQARAGVYPGTIASVVSADRLRRFFVPFDGGFRVNKTVRDFCVFARQDVTLDPPFSKLDLIVCRNLLIYLTQATQRKVMSVFHYALKPDGTLMLGRSETVGSSVDLFGLIDKRFQIYRRKPASARPELEFAPKSDLQPLAPVPKEAAPRSPRGRAAEWDAQTDANRFLLDRYAPPAVIVDGDLRIVRSRGSTRPYLELPTGDVTFDILKMVRPELLFGLRGVLQDARSRGKPATREGVRFRAEDLNRVVHLHAVPLTGGNGRQFLVMFEDGAAAGKSRDKSRPGKAAPKRPAVKDRARHGSAPTQLQEELAETRRQLQAIIDDLGAANEELQSANEEILSSNEELQSTNEELDTAKEELQSTNEELSTLNDELHGRNEELSQANSDLVNLLSSVHIPIVMVTRDLKIRRFTPAAEKTLNIIPSDVGRPIGHLKPNFTCPDLEELIGEVIDTVTIREREVQGHDGRNFALQIRPYKNIDNRIDGAVLALFDGSAAYNQKVALKQSRESGDAIIASIVEPMLVLDGDLRVTRWNRAFLDTFQVSPPEIENRPLMELGQGAWNVVPFRALLGELLADNKSFEAFTIERDVPGIGRQTILVDGRRIESDARVAILLVMRLRARPAEAAAPVTSPVG